MGKPNFTEPSTWVGLLTLVFGGWFGAQHPQVADPTFWGSLVAAVSGIYNIFVTEKKK